MQCVGSNGYMRCVSSNQFQTCSNGVWSAPSSCQSGLYCTPNGNYIYCGYTNPFTTGAVIVTTQPRTTRMLTTNNVVGPALVIESPALYRGLLRSQNAESGVFWVPTATFYYGQLQNLTITNGPEAGKSFTKIDGQYDDTDDPTLTHLWTTLTGINGTNFFPAQYGTPIWRMEDLFFGSDFYVVNTNFKVWDSDGNLRGQGGQINSMVLIDWPSVQQNSPKMETYAPTNFSGNPIISKVTLEIICRRVNNQPVTSRSAGLTTRPITSGAVTSDSVTSAVLTTNPLPFTTSEITSGELTTRATPFTTSPVTSRALTTRAVTSGSASCSVGQTKCISGGVYQTCIYVQSSSGWTGGWGSDQNCPTGTNCVQYNGYIGCS